MHTLVACAPQRQVDRKVVACICADKVVVVDQHAADERVQLERLQAQLADEQAAVPTGPPPSSRGQGADHARGSPLLQRLALQPPQVPSG